MRRQVGRWRHDAWGQLKCLPRAADKPAQRPLFLWPRGWSSMALGVLPAGSRGVPRDLVAWAGRFDAATLPVLAATADQIEALRTVEGQVDAKLVASTIGADPLILLKVMAHVARLRRGRVGGEPETLTAALVMLGIGPFFTAFGPQPAAQDRLARFPGALEGFLAVLQRSRRAARFALGFAAHRLDRDAAVIHDAALLHDFAELLLWLDSPELALELARRQAADRSVRSAEAQRQVLNFELADLQHHLMQAWRLPSLLVQITNDHAGRQTPQSTNVRLAIRVARHSSICWDNPALPDDFAEIGALLQLAPTHAAKLVREIDRG